MQGIQQANPSLNTLFQNLIRQGLHNFNRSLIRNVSISAFNFNQLSTASVPKEAEQPDEPDKLYKILELELRGNDPAVLKSFAKFATTAGNHLSVAAKR